MLSGPGRQDQREKYFCLHNRPELKGLATGQVTVCRPLQELLGMTLIYLRSTDDDIFLGGGFHAVAINDASKL